eukprot:Seg55.4 transcript_id=Seg55.4/GoldUCD/mRNA.D3Y31 product="hypothetical protein" protein_id=Seg55.4/GoldUCD/D3Y31
MGRKLGHTGLIGLRRKIKYHKSRLNHYSSQDNISTFQLVTDGSLRIILSGDVHENPGPVNNPCSVCGRAVAKNHRAIECDKCQKWCHIGNKCGKVALKTYKELAVKPDHFQWTCPRCMNDIHNPMPNIGDIAMDGSTQEQAFEEIKAKIGNRGVKIAHLNVNGLLSKLPQIEILLLECNLDILAITETHLSSKTKDHEITIINYDIERFDREEKQDKGGGGCLIYFKQSLTVYPCSSSLNIAKETESSWIELTVKSQKFLIGAIYRAPDDERFFLNFSTMLTSIRHRRKNIILLGDLLVQDQVLELELDEDVLEGKPVIPQNKTASLSLQLKTEVGCGLSLMMLYKFSFTWRHSSGQKHQVYRKKFVVEIWSQYFLETAMCWHCFPKYAAFQSKKFQKKYQ